MLEIGISRETRISLVVENTDNRLSCDIAICSLYVLSARSELTLDAYMYAKSHGHASRIWSAIADFANPCARD